MFKYILLLFAFFVSNIYAFGFVLEDSTPDAWIYATNFLDILILTIGMIISSFLYLFVLNNIVVPLLFLYLIYEIIKFLTVMLKNEDIYQSNLYNGKVFMFFFLKVLGIMLFFIGIPTGILVLSAKKNDPNKSINTISQAYTAYTLNTPKPLDTTQTLKSYGIANNWIWSNLPNTQIANFFRTIPLINSLETYEGANANITNGVFKVYLPSVLAFPISFAETFLYGNYKNGTWEPGFIPSIFNNSNSHKTGVFSLLVYDPSKIYELIFENDGLNQDYTANSLPADLYELAIKKYKYLKYLNQQTNKLFQESGISYMNIFISSLEHLFYITNQKGTINIENLIMKFNLINKKYQNNPDFIKLIDDYVNNITTYIDNAEIKRTKNGFVNLLNKTLAGSIKELKNPEIYNNDTNKMFINEKNNWKDYFYQTKPVKVKVAGNKFIQLPNIYKVNDYKNNSILFYQYLTKYQYPYLKYTKGKNGIFGSFDNSNISYTQSKQNGRFIIELVNPLNIYYSNEGGKFDSTWDNILKKYSVLYDNNYPFFSGSIRINKDKVVFSNSNDSNFYVLNKNNGNILWYSLDYEIYAAYLVSNFDIKNNKIIDFSKIENKGSFLSSNIDSFIKIINNFQNDSKTDVAFLKSLNDIKVPGYKKVYFSPIIVATKNFTNVYNSLNFTDTNLLDKILKAHDDLFTKLGMTKLQVYTLHNDLISNIYNRVRINYQNMKNIVENISPIYIRTRLEYNNLLKSFLKLTDNYYLNRDSKAPILTNNKDNAASNNNEGTNFKPTDILLHPIDTAIKLVMIPLHWILKIFKIISGIVFGLLYSIHTIGILMILIIFQFQFLFGVIFKNDYDKAFEAFRNYVAYRLIDFVYILILYIMGIIVPILLFVVSKIHLGFIVGFFLELFLMGGIFIFTGKFISAVFEMVQATDKSLQMGQMFEKFGGSINKIGGGIGAYTATKAAAGGLSTIKGLGNGITGGIIGGRDAYLNNKNSGGKIGNIFKGVGGGIYTGLKDGLSAKNFSSSNNDIKRLLSGDGGALLDMGSNVGGRVKDTAGALWDIGTNAISGKNSKTNHETSKNNARKTDISENQNNNDRQAGGQPTSENLEKFMKNGDNGKVTWTAGTSGNTKIDTPITDTSSETKKDDKPSLFRKVGNDMLGGIKNWSAVAKNESGEFLSNTLSPVTNIFKGAFTSGTPTGTSSVPPTSPQLDSKLDNLANKINNGGKGGNTNVYQTNNTTNNIKTGNNNDKNFENNKENIQKDIDKSKKDIEINNQGKIDNEVKNKK